MADYRSYIPADSGRTRESTEWSIHYSYNALDTDTPRVLLIGDSICNAYQNPVLHRLAGIANVSYWASSKCVTDPDYFRELDFILHSDPGGYAVICFNNGLHSLTTDPDAWNTAYRAALRYLSDSTPATKHFAVLSTPLGDDALNEKCLCINRMTRSAADDAAWQIIDLYGAVEDLDRTADMNDTYHWKAVGVERQADCIADRIKAVLCTEAE